MVRQSIDRSTVQVELGTLAIFTRLSLLLTTIQSSSYLFVELMTSLPRDIWRSIAQACHQHDIDERGNATLRSLSKCSVEIRKIVLPLAYQVLLISGLSESPAEITFLIPDATHSPGSVE